MNKKISSLSIRHQFLNWGASVRRLRGLATLAGSSVLFAGSLRAANTELDVASGLASGSDLSVGTSYTGGTAPTATNDVTFTAAGAYTSPYQFASNITIGSFNDLSATALTISGGAGVVTLNGGDSVSPSTGDLYYVAAGANLTFSQGIKLGATGNFDVVGTSTITSAITDGGNQNGYAPGTPSFGLVKTGSGTLILSSVNTYTAGTTVNAGTLQLNFGGQGYGGIRGVVTVNTGGTLLLNANNALGYNSATTGNSVYQVNINGGTVTTSGALGDEGYNTNFNLTGGTLAYAGTNATNAYQINAAADGTLNGSAAITSNASANLSTISGNINIRGGNLGVAVAQGTTTGGVDLLISGAVTSGGTDGLTKSGAGTEALTAATRWPRARTSARPPSAAPARSRRPEAAT